MMTTTVRPITLLAAFWVAAASTAQAQQTAPAQLVHGFDPARLTRIDSLLERYVGEDRIAGAVALILRDGQVVYERAVGWADREAERPMTMDAVFRIASQTKAITSAAVLMLIEEGKINLNDPVSRWIPSFAETTVAVDADTGLSIVPARRAITVRDLLTHTSGISYGGEPLVAPLYEAQDLGYGDTYGWYFAHRTEPICETMDRLGTLPFVQQPGEAWVYGYSTDVLGCIVERAGERSLDMFVRERITQPLGMRDTWFFLPSDQRARLAVVYTPDSAGIAVRAPEGPLGQGHYVDGPRQSFSGGAGLLSTAHDYARFLEMIRSGGALDGRRYLAPHTVALMTSNQVGTLYDDEGRGFGLGFETTERTGATGFASVGSFGWSGAYGSWYKVDPEERLVMVLMIQVVPFDDNRFREAFEAAVYQALVGP